MARMSKRGRPRKSATERRDSVITIRVRGTTHAALEQAAKAAGRTVSQEVQLRVDRSFERQAMVVDVLATTYGAQLAGVLLAIAQTMDNTGPYAAFAATMAPDSRATWLENPYAFDQASKAVARLLEALRPDGAIVRPQLAAVLEQRGAELGDGIAASIIEAIAGRPATKSLETFSAQVRPLLGRLAEGG
jgi:hypothetical protein